MAACSQRCGCGSPCKRRDAHGIHHVCIEGWGCNTRCPKCGHHGLGHRDHNDEGKHHCGERMSYDNNDFCGCTHGCPPVVLPSPIPASLTFYVVRNFEGKWCRSKGQNASGKTWVDDILSAKIYVKLSQARARVTYFARLNANLPPPQIVEFFAAQGQVVDQADRIASANQKCKEKKARAEAERKERALKEAEAELRVAQENLRRLKGEPVSRRHDDDCGCKSCVGM